MISIRKFLKGILIQNDTDKTKELELQVSGSANSATKTTLIATQSVDRSVTLPDADTILVGEDNTATLTNKTIDGDTNTVQDLPLTSLKTNLTDADKFIVRDASGIPVSNSKDVPAGDVIGSSDSQTLTNKTIDADLNTISNIDNNEIKSLAGIDATKIADGTVSNTEFQYLQNVTSDIQTQLGNNASNLTNHISDTTTHGTTGDIVGTSDSQVLTNKTIDAGSNTISNIDNSHISSTAAIDATKIADGSVTSTEFQYINSLTSNAQTQLNGKAATDLSNLASTAFNAPIVPVSDGALDLGSILKRLDAVYAKSLRDASSQIVVDITNRKLEDSTSSDSIDFQNRQLKTGSTMKLDWSGNAPKMLSLASDPASPSSGQIYFNSTSNKYRFYNGSTWQDIGSGSSGSKNYFTSDQADGNTAVGFNGYADAAGVLPVDGTGGSVSGNLTFSSSSSSPLSGLNSLVLAKAGASNLQGNGYSIDFTLDTSDKGKVLAFSMNYAIASGTYADNDVIVMFYDVTNSTLLQPTPFQIKNHTLGSDKFFCEIQTPSNCNTLRMIFHVSSTSASNYSLKFDDLLFGPQAKLYGSSDTDWVSYTPTGSWTSNSTYTGKWRRVGDSMEIAANVVLSGAPNAANLTINIPSGYTIDISKTTASGITAVGVCGILDSGVSIRTGVVLTNSTTSVSMYSADSTNDFSVAYNQPITFGNGDVVSTSFKVPIVGWSSSQLLSSDADTRVIAVSANSQTPTGTLNSSNNIVKFGTIANDTHGGYDTVTGLFTVKVPGYYRISSALEISATWSVGNYARAAIGVNGSNVNSQYLTAFSSTTTSICPIISGIVKVSVGDTIGIYSQTNGTTPSYVTSLSGSSFSIERLSGPAQIAASEEVNCSYYNTAGTAIVYNALTTIAFPTKVYDSHGAYNTSTGVFTAPVSGKYRVEFRLITSPVTTTANTSFNSAIMKNGSYYRSSGEHIAQVVYTGNMFLFGSATVYLLAGETTSASYFFNINASGTTLTTNQQENWLTIEKVG